MPAEPWDEAAEDEAAAAPDSRIAYIARARASDPSPASPWDESPPQEGDGPSPAGVHERAVSAFGAVDRALSGAPVLDYQPDSWRMTRAHHCDAATAHANGYLRAARLTWGWLDLLACYPLLIGMKWLTKHPSWFFAALGLVITFWIWR